MQSKNFDHINQTAAMYCY